MFRTVFPSIIRSSRLYIQQQAYVKQILPTTCQQAVGIWLVLLQKHIAPNVKNVSNTVQQLIWHNVTDRPVVILTGCTINCDWHNILCKLKQHIQYYVNSTVQYLFSYLLYADLETRLQHNNSNGSRRYRAFMNFQVFRNISTSKIIQNNGYPLAVIDRFSHVLSFSDCNVKNLEQLIKLCNSQRPKKKVFSFCSLSFQSVIRFLCVVFLPVPFLGPAANCFFFLFQTQG